VTDKEQRLCQQPLREKARRLSSLGQGPPPCAPQVDGEGFHISRPHLEALLPRRRRPANNDLRAFARGPAKAGKQQSKNLEASS